MITRSSLCHNLLVTSLFILPSLALAQQKAEVPYTPPVELGEEYEEYAVSGPKGGSKGGKSSQTERSTAERVLLYLPNRIFDLFDIVRADVGVGLSAGGVVRVTKWVQVGYREFNPASVRIGLRGRKPPAWIERSNEFGAGPAFVPSKDRRATPGEIGIGIDPVICGAYVGVSLDELADFAAGFVGIDFKEDDF